MPPLVEVGLSDLPKSGGAIATPAPPLLRSLGISWMSNYKKKNSYLVLTSGSFLEALGSGIGTGLVFCHSFSFSNNVMKLCNFIVENLFSLVS